MVKAKQIKLAGNFTPQAASDFLNEVQQKGINDIEIDSAGNSVFDGFPTIARYRERRINATATAINNAGLEAFYIYCLADKRQCLSNTIFTLERATLPREIENNKAEFSKHEAEITAINDYLKDIVSIAINEKEFKNITGYSFNEVFSADNKIQISFNGIDAQNMLFATCTDYNNNDSIISTATDLQKSIKNIPVIVAQAQPITQIKSDMPIQQKENPNPLLELAAFNAEVKNNLKTTKTAKEKTTQTAATANNEERLFNKYKSKFPNLQPTEIKALIMQAHNEGVRQERNRAIGFINLKSLTTKEAIRGIESGEQAPVFAAHLEVQKLKAVINSVSDTDKFNKEVRTLLKRTA